MAETAAPAKVRDQLRAKSVGLTYHLAVPVVAAAVFVWACCTSIPIEPGALESFLTLLLGSDAAKGVTAIYSRNKRKAQVAAGPPAAVDLSPSE